MRYPSLMIAGVALLCGMASLGQAQTVHRWEFDRIDDREGWTVSDDWRGVVMGGAWWVSLAPPPELRAKFSKSVYQVFGPRARAVAGEPASALPKPPTIAIHSPASLTLARPTDGAWQVTLRLINLSPVTSIDLTWVAAGGQVLGTRKCAVVADCKAWQELRCAITDSTGVIDRIALQIAPPLRGDLWIDRITIQPGPRPASPARPEIASERVVPKISVEGLTHEGFAEAFRILDDNLYVETPINGFAYPIMRPGGIYQDWWLYDGVIQAQAARWTNQPFAENVMRGFAELQAANPDGRLDMAGYAAVRGQVADLSGAPGVFFEAAYVIARGSRDPALRGTILTMMARYLDWWLSPVKRDPTTGLVSAIHEETFGEECTLLHIVSDTANAPQAVAPVDLNVDVAVGAALTAELAAALGRPADAARYRAAHENLARAINAHFWDEGDGVYYNYDLRARRLRKQLRVTMFDPLRRRIAPPARQARLLERLTDPAQFNWGTVPLTSRSKRDPGFVEQRPRFDHAAWCGSMWPALNLDVVLGLEDSGHHQLAAELTWQTITALHGNYAEFLTPSTGEGQGAKRYGISAAKYLSAVIEHLFGVQVDAVGHRVSIVPHVPPALYGKTIALEGLILSTRGASRLSVSIQQTSRTAATIAIAITGDLPPGDLVVRLPGAAKARRVPMRRAFTAIFH